MKKIYSAVSYGKIALLSVVIIFSQQISNAQTTINTTVGTTNYTAGNGVGGNSCITFVIENTSATPMLLTQVGQYFETASNNTIVSLWYSSTSLSGQPTITTPVWTQIITSTPIPVTSEGIKELFTGLSFTIPAGAQYRFAIQSTINIRYSGASPIPSPSTFSVGGLTLKCGDVQISGNNVGYGGAFPTPPSANNPRWFTGSITFQPALPCTTPPVAGTATATPSLPVCPGAAIALNLTGNTIGTGQTFQWESATAIGGPYSPVGAASPAPGLNITAPGTTTYYRAAVTCSGNTQYSTPVEVVVNTGFPGGNYTINSAVPTGGNNFQTFSDAVNAIRCGITGPVVFTVEPGSGPYTEQVTIPQIAGASSTNTITFYGSGETLRFSPIADARQIIRLDGADHVTFRRLNIVAQDGGTYGWGVHLTNGADNNTIDSCTIDISAITSTTQSNSAGIVASGSPTVVTTAGSASNNIISNNTITGAYQGIILSATATALNGVNNTITRNTIGDFYANGITLTQQDGAMVSYNNIHRANRGAVTTFTGIELGTGNRNCVVNANRIHDTHTSATSLTGQASGIFSSSDDAPAGSENKITNNLLYNFNGSGTIYGLYNTGSDGVFYYHNTVSFDYAGATAGTTRGIYQTTQAARIEYRNNIISISRGGTGVKHGIYMNTATTTFTSDYNNFYITPGADHHVGYNGSNQTTLANWIANTPHDDHSFDLDPQYLDPNTGNYFPNNGALDNKGTPVGITTDILSLPRSATTPDIGAYEFAPIVCTDPPTPGTITSTLNPVCVGVEFTLGLTGGTIGAGLSYQWQSSSDNTNWQNITGATSSTLVTTQLQTTYYRVVYTCGTSVPSASIQVVTPTGLSGTYTIDKLVPTGGTNFASFNDAYNAMACGISGPVVFNVATGGTPYNEQLIMAPIPGASGTNTVTFNGNGNTITWLSTNTNERATIKLNGADHITFDSLIINATGASASEYGWAVQLTNSADSNTFSRCSINANTTATSTAFAGVVLSNSATSATTGGAQCDGNVFDRNTITGGYYSMVLAGTATLVNFQNRVTRNILKEFYFYGLYVSGSTEIIVDSNQVTRPTRTVLSEFNGIYFTSLSSRAVVTRNTITNPYGGDPAATTEFNGIFFNANDPLPANVNVVSNNLIYNITGNGNVTGLHNAGSNNTSFYHNTVVLDGAAAATTATNFTRGFYQTTDAQGIEVKNNVIVISRGGVSTKHVMYFNTPSSGIVSDRNDLFISSSTGSNSIGFANGDNQLILANWQLATGQDANSISNDPLFVNTATGNYTPANVALNDIALPVGVAIDILGAPRHATNPDPGAYEFAPPPCITPPTPGAAGVSSNPVCENSLVQLSVSGHSTGFGQTYIWQASGTVGGPYANISGTLVNPSFTVTASSTLYYRVAVTCGTETAYSTPVLLNVTPGLPGGIYTIDQTDAPSPTNFISFNAAREAMACGITGPVVFNVVPNTGPYNEQVVFDSIPGASRDNTITFNGNGNVIHFSSTVSAERAVIKLNSADHFTFDSLVIDATGTGTYGWGVHLLSNADSNTFRKNTVLLNTTSTSTNYAGMVISGSATSATTTTNSLCDFNTFSDNTISGGYYGIVMTGSTAVGSNIYNNRVLNNKITDFYLYGIYAGGNNGTRIERNDISRPLRANNSTTIYGIYFTGVSARCIINANRIHNMYGGDPTTTDDVTGIMMTGVDAVAAESNLITNNAIYDMNGNGDIYGINNTGSNNAKYYHNTISLDHAASTTTLTTRGFYQTTEADLVDFRNNIVTVTRGGTGNKHAVYYNTLATVFISDHNDLHVSGTNAHIGYYDATSRTSMTDWRNATSQDAASDSLNPQYTSPITGDLTPQLGAIDNKGIPVGVTADIQGAVRSLTTPDYGAFEFAITPCTTPPTAGIATANPSAGICLGETVLLDLTGNSTGGFQTYKWQRSSSATGPWTDITGELFSPQHSYTINSTETWFRAVVTCSGVPANSTPVQVVLNPLLLAGDYTINPSIPTGGNNYQSFVEAVAVLECGITGAIRFHVVPGTYTEQVRMRRVPGSSATNTVTFMSQNGDPASVTLTYNATSPDFNYVLKLDSADHIIYKNMTIAATNTTNGRAVELAGTSSGDSILHCIIQAPVSSSTANTIAGVFATNLAGSYNVIKGNTVTNGSAGIYLSGTTLVSNDIVVDSNTVNGSYYYGIYAANINNAKLNRNKVTRTGLLNTTAYGIYVSNCDSAYQVNNNTIDIVNAGTIIYGAYLTGCQSVANLRGSVSNNRVTGTTGNTGNQYGIYITTSTFADIRNNAVAINTSGASSYGTYLTGVGGMNFHNNSVSSVATSATNNIAAYFSQTSGANGAVNIRNNIFSHTGGGRAMYTANPDFIYSDYNMFYSSGTTLIQWGTANNYATLKQWADTSYWDLNSIRYQPAFTSASDLSPNIASPDVWAIHGRGVQIPGNNRDINDNPRPVTLATGVPDLGAFEFVPTSVPVALTAIPANPVANTSQVFMLGTDTVTRINWGANVPTSVTGRRYTGTIPPSLVAAQQHMYFYTDFDVTGTMPTGHGVQQHFMNPWLGTIPAEAFLKLGRTDASNVWQVSTSSTLDSIANTLTENNLTLLDKYTGLTDGVAIQPPPIVISPSDLSNSGTKFWVAYGHQYYFSTNNSQSMVLYLGAGPNPASVTVKVNGTNWSKTYNVPANTTIASDFMPKAGALDARLLEEGWSDRGISIESNTPITAFAHIYSSASSGATMLMPVGAYGYEYYALTSKQNYSGNSHSWFYVIAPYDSTVVEITPSAPTVGGHPAGVPFTVTLKKGEVYQVLGQKTTASAGYDMTGSKVKSIANSAGKCYPIAMFSGSSRTAIACDDAVPTLNGDNIIQQNFPYRAWGKRYLTAPTSASTGATTMHTNLYKVAVKDPTTEVRVNGTLQTNLINGLYYQFTTNASAYIEADKPVMVAQFIGSTSECNGTGVYDPEMIYLSPIEQGIKKVGLYRNTEDAITVQYLTLVIPNEGLASLTIDGSNTFDHVYDHYLTGYKVVVKRWTAASAPAIVQSDYAFTGITYGLGSVESYGYNAGTLILNLNVLPSITNVFNPAGTPNDYTCAGTPFTVSFLSTVQPSTIEWNFSQVPTISPNADVVQNNPVHVGTEVINGITYYRYTLAQQYVFNTPGTYHIPIAITHPEVEGCNNRMPSSIPVTVIGSPTADFNNLVSACPGSPVSFDGSTSATVNGVPVVTWNWNFGDNGTGTGQTTTHTYTNAGVYDVELDVIAAEGCIASVTKPVTVGNGPVVAIVPDSVGVCPNGDATFTVQNPLANATYEWYTTPTGGSPVATGTSFTITNITGPVSYYVGSVLNGCPGLERKRVQATVNPALATPVAIVDSVGTNLVRFRWSAVPNATGYQVTTNGGTSWVTPSSGTTGLTHTVTGLSIGQTVTLRVRAVGGCLPAESQAVSGTTVTDQLYLPNAFTPNNDGRNDEWRIYGNVIRSIRAMVFNQWGEKIVEVTNPTRAADGGYRIWDGTHKGEQQPSGVYMYVCEITLTDGTKVQRKGSINLAR